MKTVAMKHIQIGKYRLPVPATRGRRLGLGWALIVGGILGFLPILGFWMIPLGIVVLRAGNPVKFPRWLDRYVKRRPVKKQQ